MDENRINAVRMIRIYEDNWKRKLHYSQHYVYEEAAEAFAKQEIKAAFEAFKQGISVEEFIESRVWTIDIMNKLLSKKPK